MGKGDRRRSLKMKRRKNQRKKKARERALRAQWMMKAKTVEISEEAKPKTIRIRPGQVSE